MPKKSSLLVLLLVIVAIIIGAWYIFNPQSKSILPLLGQNQVNQNQLGQNTGNSISNGMKIAGMEGVKIEDFSFIKSWGANTVHYYKFPGDTNTVSSVLTAAKSNGLSLMVSISKINQFNDSFDLASLRADPNRYLPDNQIVAGDPAFLGYWLIDEPCNPSKRSPVQAADFNDLYLAVKAINPKVPLVINFGYLECLQGFVNASQPGWKLADIAMFTITEKKLKDKPNLIAEQAAIAKSVKLFDPNMKILPQIAVLEFTDKGRSIPLPSSSWTQSTGLETEKYLGSFDGLIYYSFHSYENVKFIGKSVSDVKSDPAYANAFKTVFADVK